MQIEELLGYLSPEAQAFITQALQTGQQDVIDTIMQVIQAAPSIQEGIAMVEQAIQEFLAAEGGGAPVGPPGAPGAAVAGGPPPGAPVDMPAPVGPQDGMVPPPGAVPPMPPGMPPEMMGMPPGMVDPLTGMPAAGGAPLPGGPEMGMPPPPAPPQRPKEKAPPKPPKYAPPAVKKVKKPSYDQILEDARAGRDYWAARDARIQADKDLYHLNYDAEMFGGKDSIMVGNSVVHQRSQPNTLVNLVTSLTTAKNDKLRVEVEPRSDSTEYQEASQDAEDAVLCWREDDEERWLEERINEPPLPRKEAGLAALEGGFGWSWFIDADNEECPFQYEVIPLSQLYDVGHACTRQYTLPLHLARARFEQVEEAYKLEDKNRGWDPNQKVRIIIHGDNYGVWRSIVWEEMGTTTGTAKSMTGDSPRVSERVEDGYWILKPEKVNFGFRYFSYMVWGGSPAENVFEAEEDLLGFKGHGVLTMLRKTFRLVNMWVSALATGSLKAVDPAWVLETDAPNPQRLDTSPDGFNPIRKGDKAYPLVYEFSKNADASALIQSLLAELNDVSSPALMGAPGVSGIAQQVSTEQASQQVVGPIIDAMEKWYALQHKQRLILALRYSGDTKYNKDADDKDNTLFEKYPKRSLRSENRGTYGYLKPTDIEKSGVRVKVRYTDRNLQEEMALSQMVTGLVNAHLMSQETAMRRMGVQDPQKEMLRIFADGAYMEPTVLKALVETAVYTSGNEQLINAWDKAFYADMVKGAAGNGGSPPAPNGTPSMANQPGSNVTGTSSANMNPGQQAMGQAGY